MKNITSAATAGRDILCHTLMLGVIHQGDQGNNKHP